MQIVDDLRDTAGFYSFFAETEAKGESATFADWAAGVARDPEVLALLDRLPPVKRQPNLVFAAARWHGARTPSDYGVLREVLLEAWPQVEETILARSTQTNEVGRCATLLPVLGGLGGPLALLEVGASAGLCLHPDRWSYRYLDAAGVEQVRAEGGRAHWISNEGAPVLPDVTATAACAGRESDFCLGLDGTAVGWTHGHGRHLTWC